MHKKQTAILHKRFTEAAHNFLLANYQLGEIYAYTKLANYFSKNNNIKLAEKYNLIILEINKTIDDANTKEMVYLNVANFYNAIGDTDQAIKYYKQLEESIEITNNTKRLKPLYNNLGVVYLKKYKWEEAKSYLNKSLAIKKLEKDTLGIFSSYQNLFRISLRNKQLNDAKHYFLRLSELHSKVDVPDDILLAFKYNCTEYKILTGSKEESLANFRDYTAHKDTLSNAAFSNKLIQIEQNFEVQKRDNEIELLQQNEELNKAKVHSLYLGISFIAVLLVVLLFNGFYMKHQWAKLLRSEEKLQIKQKEINLINETLELSNKSKDRILSVIGHDLRGPVGGLKELIELYMELPEFEPEDITNLLKSARESSTSAYHLLENLLSWANSQRGQISFNPVQIPIQPLVKNSVQLLDNSINNKNIQFQIDIPSSIVLNVDINMMKVIIRNLVSNAIKYSPKESTITITATEHEKHFDLSVSDEGIGISENEANHILSKKKTYYLDNDKKIKGTGLGLVLCKEFIEYHNGIIAIKSNTNIGTSVCIRIPKNLEKLTLADSKVYQPTSVI